MSISRPFFAVAVVALVTALTAALTAAPPLPAQLNVTTTIADVAGDFPLRLQSDRQGAYVTKSVGKNVKVPGDASSRPIAINVPISDAEYLVCAANNAIALCDALEAAEAKLAEARRALELCAEAKIFCEDSMDIDDHATRAVHAALSNLK